MNATTHIISSVGMGSMGSMGVGSSLPLPPPRLTPPRLSLRKRSSRSTSASTSIVTKSRAFITISAPRRMTPRSITPDLFIPLPSLNSPANNSNNNNETSDWNNNNIVMTSTGRETVLPPITVREDIINNGDDNDYATPTKRQRRLLHMVLPADVSYSNSNSTSSFSPTTQHYHSSPTDDIYSPLKMNMNTNTNTNRRPIFQSLGIISDNTIGNVVAPTAKTPPGKVQFTPLLSPPPNLRGCQFQSRYNSNYEQENPLSAIRRRLHESVTIMDATPQSLFSTSCKNNKVTVDSSLMIPPIEDLLDDAPVVSPPVAPPLRLRRRSTKSCIKSTMSILRF